MANSHTMRIILKIVVPILLTVFFVYLPFFARPEILLNRNNDLTGFFWPIIYYIKNSILVHGQIPLWNNLFFLGTPLVSDPQNIFWYLPNSLFLIFPVNVGIFITFLVHTFFGGIGMYFFSRSLKLSNKASVFAACLVIAAPKLQGYIEAGHYGLVLSFAWLPWFFLSIKKLIDEPKLRWAVLLAVSLSSIYFNHILTAFITSIAGVIFALTNLKRTYITKLIIYGGISVVLFFLTIFPAYISQYQWFPETTRNMLLTYPDVYPKWNTELEYLTNIFTLKSPETEKIITVGIFLLALSLVGFAKIKIKLKIILITVTTLIVFISANNVSPFYDILIHQNWYILLRVATRTWFVITLITILLATYGFEIIYTKQKNLAYLLCLCVLIESLLAGYKIISKPVSLYTPSTPSHIYEFLSTDKDVFRVFCTTRCLGQKEAAIYGLHLADGYGTLQQKNYYEAAKQIGQYYSDRYSLSIPPFDVYLYQKLQPNSQILANYGVKYIVSPHQLKDKNLIPLKKYDNYTVYKNNLFISPNYTYYSPNLIEIYNRDLRDIFIVPEIYNSNWYAYTNQKRIEVFETEDHVIGIKTLKSERISLKYQPYKFLFDKKF